MKIVTSIKCIDFLDCSVVNLMVGWVLLSVSMKSVSLSCPCVQILKMSSMKRHHTRGLCRALSRALVSRTFKDHETPFSWEKNA